MKKIKRMKINEEQILQKIEQKKERIGWTYGIWDHTNRQLVQKENEPLIRKKLKEIKELATKIKEKENENIEEYYYDGKPKIKEFTIVKLKVRNEIKEKIKYYNDEIIYL